MIVLRSYFDGEGMPKFIQVKRNFDKLIDKVFGLDFTDSEPDRVDAVEVSCSGNKEACVMRVAMIYSGESYYWNGRQRHISLKFIDHPIDG